MNVLNFIILDKEGNNVHVHFSFRGGNDIDSPIDVDHSHEVNIDEGVVIEERDGDHLDIPEDPNGEILGRLGHQGLGRYYYYYLHSVV